MSRPAGRFVALEGVDGCGKSTQARWLSQSLDALCTREPGGTPLGHVIRELVLGTDPPTPSRAPVPRAEALLLIADRAQHVEEVVRPALESGRWVVTDRFSGSTLAYQGFGRGLGLDWLRAASEWATDGVVPDLSVLLDVQPLVARRRLDVAASDRLERMDPGFFSRVRDGYVELAARDPEHWVVVDGEGAPEDVAASVLGEVDRRLRDRHC